MVEEDTVTEKIKEGLAANLALATIAAIATALFILPLGAPSLWIVWAFVAFTVLGVLVDLWT